MMFVLVRLITQWSKVTTLRPLVSRFACDCAAFPTESNLFASGVPKRRIDRNCFGHRRLWFGRCFVDLLSSLQIARSELQTARNGRLLPKAQRAKKDPSPATV
jgi:hypothetical protein